MKVWTELTEARIETDKIEFEQVELVLERTPDLVLLQLKDGSRVWAKQADYCVARINWTAKHQGAYHAERVFFQEFRACMDATEKKALS